MVDLNKTAIISAYFVPAWRVCEMRVKCYLGSNTEGKLVIMLDIGSSPGQSREDVTWMLKPPGRSQPRWTLIIIIAGTYRNWLIIAEGNFHFFIFREVMRYARVLNALHGIKLNYFHYDVSEMAKKEFVVP